MATDNQEQIAKEILISAIQNNVLSLYLDNPLSMSANNEAYAEELGLFYRRLVTAVAAGEIEG